MLEKQGNTTGERDTGEEITSITKHIKKTYSSTASQRAKLTRCIDSLPLVTELPNKRYPCHSGNALIK